MQTIIIVAMTKDGLIGANGRLPWNDRADMAHFKRTTMGHAVVMGRKTFDSIGRPLPGRRNVVLSRERNLKIDGAEVVESFEDAIDLCRKNREAKVYIIGGAQLYEQGLAMADEMIVTMMEQQGLEGDTYFPEWNRGEWETGPSQTGDDSRVQRFRRRG
jgi:dihydrofolate reductase